MRRVCLSIIDRANWGRLEPLAREMQSDTRIDLSLLCGGSTTLKRFGGLADELAGDGYDVASRLFNEIEGSTPLTMARSGGLCQMDAAAELARLDPNIVVLIGDRYQALAVATAAVTLGIPLVHLQGGEVSGSLDERYRHAITKLADYHVPATKRAAEYLIRMGERPESILCVGCPGVDIVPVEDWIQPHCVLVVYHPDTNCAETACGEMRAVLMATQAAAHNHLKEVFWPNIDAGADEVSKVIRQHAELSNLTTIKNLSPAEYAGLLKNAACAIGNSSSFIRDSARFGTPVVLVGSRQDGRERGPNVMSVPAKSDVIAAAIRQQLSHGRYDPSDLYGSPGISQRICEAIVALEPVREKRLAYV